MAMPLNVLSTTPAPAAFLPPDDQLRPDLLTDYELGGVALNDPTQGLQFQVWTATVAAGIVYATPADVGGPIAVLNDTDITEVSLTWDQNMRPCVAYMAGGVCKLRWYDTAVGAQVTTTYASATSPTVTLDDKRLSQVQVGSNDILFFYIRAGQLYHRRQRDRFTIEYSHGAIPSGTTRIRRAGMNRGNRLQLEFSTAENAISAPSGPPADTYGTAHTDMLTDTLYFESGGEVLPFFQGTGRLTGIWKSPRFVLNGFPSFTWCRLNGPLTAPVTVRLYADGALKYTAPATSSATPFRLPAGRHRHLEIEVESTSAVTSVTIASSAEELT